MLQILRYHYKNLETLNVFWADREVVKTWGRRTPTRPRGVRISWPASSASQVRRVTAHQHLWGGGGLQNTFIKLCDTSTIALFCWMPSIKFN